MSYLTENERLWIEARKILVKHGVITPNGEGTTEGFNDLQRKLRKLLLGDTK